MPQVRVKDGLREGKHILQDAGRLMRAYPAATAGLGLALAMLPALLKAFLVVRAQEAMLGVWGGWLAALVSGEGTGGFLSLVSLTLQQSGYMGLPVTLLDLLKSLILSPLLLSSLALLYNGYVSTFDRSPFAAARQAARNVRDLIIVALACMLAEWLVQMVPSLVSGVLSLLAEMVSWIPFLGTLVYVLAVALSLLVSLLTDFAVIVIFCYVWICAVCEGVSGFGALVRSWQVTRNTMHQTIAALLSLLLLRWLLVLALGLLWLFALRPLGVPLAAVVYAAYAASALYTVALGAVTSALYQHRPLHGGPRPGQFRSGGPDLDNLKRANLD